MRTRGFRTAGIAALAALVPAAGPAVTACLPPERPFLPADPADARLYADLIRADFEGYIRAIEGYFRCLDAERARAFAEAREVSQDYGRFVELVGVESEQRPE